MLEQLGLGHGPKFYPHLKKKKKIEILPAASGINAKSAENGDPLVAHPFISPVIRGILLTEDSGERHRKY